MADFAYVIGFRWPCVASCLTRPGCAMSAMSGGWPPATAVPTTVGTLLPTGLYLILTFGYCWLNAAITFAKEAASAPVQIPSKVTLPLTLLLEDVVLLELFVLLLLLLLFFPQ